MNRYFVVLACLCSSLSAQDLDPAAMRTDAGKALGQSIVLLPDMLRGSWHRVSSDGAGAETVAARCSFVVSGRSFSSNGQADGFAGIWLKGAVEAPETAWIQFDGQSHYKSAIIRFHAPNKVTLYIRGPLAELDGRWDEPQVYIIK